jgi:hypothetical protein
MVRSQKEKWNNTWATGKSTVLLDRTQPAPSTMVLSSSMPKRAHGNKEFDNSSSEATNRKHKSPLFHIASSSLQHRHKCVNQQQQLNPGDGGDSAEMTFSTSHHAKRVERVIKAGFPFGQSRIVNACKFEWYSVSQKRNIMHTPFAIWGPPLFSCMLLALQFQKGASSHDPQHWIAPKWHTHTDRHTDLNWIQLPKHASRHAKHQKTNNSPTQMTTLAAICHGIHICWHIIIKISTTKMVQHGVPRKQSHVDQSKC